jgi:predicted transcriptional regulator
MSTTIFTLHPDMDVWEAIDLLVRRDVSGAPVVDDEKRMVGILTEKDCLRVVSHEGFGTLSVGKVRDYMSPVKHTVQAHMDIFTVAHLFLANNFPSLPVLDNQRLVGRIARRDVLRGIVAMQHSLEELRRQAERDLRMKQSPASINDMQRLVASERIEHLAALFRMRHDDHEQ